jgi:hypothetical protein
MAKQKYQTTDNDNQNKNDNFTFLFFRNKKRSLRTVFAFLFQSSIFCWPFAAILKTTFLCWPAIVAEF